MASGDWPREAVVVAVRREEELLVPRGDLVLRPGDRVALLGPAGEGDRLRHFLADAAGTPTTEPGDQAAGAVVATLTADAASSDGDHADTP